MALIKDTTPDLAGLLGMWCTSVLYGVKYVSTPTPHNLAKIALFKFANSVVMYFTCIYILLKRKSKGINGIWILLGSATLQFILSTMYVAVALRMAMESFLWLTPGPGAAAAYWANPSKPILALSKGIYITNTLIGDMILVWRLYVVWGGKYYVHVLPGILLVGTTVCGYISLAHLAHLTSLDALFLIGKTLLATWALTIATQVSASILIAGRIWWIARQSAPVTYPTQRRQHISVIWIIVESGAIYTITTVFLLAFFDLKTQAGAIIGDILAQIGAIVPTTIIVRVGLGLARESSTINQPSSDFPLRSKAIGSGRPAAIQISTTTGKEGESQISDTYMEASRIELARQ